jgi:hypothetical protein
MRELSAAAAWSIATRVYPDLSVPETERERAWLERAVIAYRAGNPLHLPRMVEVYAKLGVPPHDDLAAALGALVRVALSEGAFSLPVDRLMTRLQPKARERADDRHRKRTSGGRHARPVTRAVELVLAVESAIRLTWASEQLATRKGARPRGYGAKDLAAEWFREHAKLDPKLLSRTPEQVVTQAKRGRKVIADPVQRAFIGANFPPLILDTLLRPSRRGRKHR